MKKEINLDEVFNSVFPLIQKGYNKQEACKKLGLNRNIVQKFTDAQKRLIDEAQVLQRNHDYTQKGKRR